MNRRGFIKTLGGILVAPAVIKVDNLMALDARPFKVAIKPAPPLFDEEALLAAIRSCYRAGGDPTMIQASPATMARMREYIFPVGEERCIGKHYKMSHEIPEPHPLGVPSTQPIAVNVEIVECYVSDFGVHDLVETHTLRDGVMLVTDEDHSLRGVDGPNRLVSV